MREKPQRKAAARLRASSVLATPGTPSSSTCPPAVIEGMFKHPLTDIGLERFLKDGARRFIFEGRECGGHVGPRSSFVLWETMIEVLLEHLGARGDGFDVIVDPLWGEPGVAAMEASKRFTRHVEELSHYISEQERIREAMMPHVFADNRPPAVRRALAALGSM